MVCSTCGHENQVGNRFCGMCGTPLPHRPLTTPGAQSTASLTRPLGENPGPNARPLSAVPSSRTIAKSDSRLDPSHEQDLSQSLLEDKQVPTPAPSGRLTVVSRNTAPDKQSSNAGASALELVPEIPLHEYVQSFRYVPPSDPEEITMRGEAAVAAPEPPPQPETIGAGVEVKAPAPEAAPPPPSAGDDVRERLGLETESAAEERKDRPRFLDFNEPTAPIAPADSATSIAGPSFLGLSDAPQMSAPSAEELVAEPPSRGGWRIVMAAAVILVFGFLGILEWRAQLRQTNSGPVEVIKMKMRKLTQGNPAPNVPPESGTSLPVSDSASKPEVKVEPSPSPQNQNSPAEIGAAASKAASKNEATVPSSNTSTAPPASSSSATLPVARNQAVPGQSAPQSQGPALAQGGTSAGMNGATAKTTATTAVAAKTKTVSPVTDNGADVLAKKPVPGAEELAKADNASDSTAEAAWLWKATAKGNPAAPVRLADMYIKGDGVPHSCEQAMVLLKTAAEKQNAPARNRLASMYSAGTCVQKNRLEAYRWVSSALDANPNSEWAQQRKEQLWQQMTPQERTFAAKYK